MYIIASHMMPITFQERMPFKNQTKDDIPLYEYSFAVFETDPVDLEYLAIDYQNLQFVGFLPFVNLKVSNRCPHKGNRGKTFKEGVYTCFVNDYKVESLWSHKALFVFNSRLVTDKKIKFYRDGNTIFSKPSAKELISTGWHRDIPADFYNERNKGNVFYGINIHRGPRRDKLDYNYSYGCVTVDPPTFDKFMKSFQYYEMAIYIHKIDTLANDQDNYSYKYIGGLDYNNIRLLNDYINAQINSVRPI